MSENPNAPISSSLQKSVIPILQSIVIALLIWVGTSINANNEKIVLLQKDVQSIQLKQDDLSKQIEKMVTKEVLDMHLKTINTQFESLNNRVTKLEK